MEIIRLYSTREMTSAGLTAKYHTGWDNIRRILEENGVDVRRRGDNSYILENTRKAKLDILMDVKAKLIKQRNDLYWLYKYYDQNPPLLEYLLTSYDETIKNLDYEIESNKSIVLSMRYKVQS